MTFTYIRRAHSWLPDSLKRRVEAEYSVQLIRSVSGNPLYDEQEFFIYVIGDLDPRHSLMLDILLSDYIIS